MSVFRSAVLTPDDVLCADSVEFVIRIAFGDEVSAEAFRLVFDFSSMLGTSCPSRYVNEASGYVEAYLSNPVVDYSIRCWDLDLGDYARPDRAPSREAQRMVVLDIGPGSRPGDTLEFHWGETYDGFGPGTKVTSVVPRPEHYGRIDVRYFVDPEAGIPDHGFAWAGSPRPEPDAVAELRYRVRPREVARLRLLRGHAGARLLPLDTFHNVAEDSQPSALVEGPDPDRRNALGVFEYADNNVQLRSRGLPLRSTPTFENVWRGHNVYWGDLHTHSVYSIDCIQRARIDMTPAELMDFARYRQGLDFFAVSDHHQPKDDAMRHLGATAWAAPMDDVRSRHVPGEFVVFPALEFRDRRGDTVVVCNWEPDYAEIEQPEWREIRDLWAAWRGRDYLSIPHFHNLGGLAPDEWWANPDFAGEPVLEIFSDHGSYEREDTRENGRALCKGFRPDRCGVHFLKQGYKYGFVANSDDHKGHVGVNGLTAVYAPSLDRDDILNAYRERRVYATTNARIRLLFTANDALMGSVLAEASEKELRIEAVGENQLKRVDLFRNGDLYQTLIPDGTSFAQTIRIASEGPDNWYVRVTQVDNHIAWSSPIWFE
jgi:hypothetical protein